MAGLGVGLGAFLTLVYTPSVTTTTASSIGMNIFIAIVFGGMPISGGARSRIYAALVGGFSFILLNDILELVIDGSAAYGITQVIRTRVTGILRKLSACLFSCLKSRRKRRKCLKALE